MVPAIDSFLIKNIIDSVEQGVSLSGDELFHSLLKWIIIYTIWWEGLNWSWRLYDYLYLKFIPQAKITIIDNLFNHTQHHSQRFFQDNFTGNVTNRITEAAKAYEYIFALSNECILRKLVVILGALVAMYYVNHIFALVFFIWIIFFVGLQLFFSTRINRYANSFARARAVSSGKIVDALANIATIRSFASHSYERKFLGKYLNLTLKADRKLQWFMFKLRYFLGLSCSIMIFCMLYYLVTLRSQMKITVGDFALIISLALAVADDVWNLIQEVGDLFEHLGTCKQSLTLLAPHEVKEDPNSSELQVTKGCIEFKNVTFKYKFNDNIFENTSIKIEGKKKVGLVGFSGSGKSTFVNLINRLYDISSGEILIDGQNIARVSFKSLRNNISVIPQDPVLFHRTILENITYGNKDASMEEVIKVCKQSHIHDHIMALPDGYYSECGERGSRLSGGQRQRIAIARALLKNSPILILDEATSALDSVTENQIQASLAELMDGKTVLVIAHRLSTLLNMDYILVFDKGCIVEEGTHNELLSNGKVYKKLWDSQVGGFFNEEIIEE